MRVLLNPPRTRPIAIPRKVRGVIVVVIVVVVVAAVVVVVTIIIIIIIRIIGF